jgi:hypothetical protein
MKPRYKAVLIDDEEENRLTPITDRFSKNLSFRIDILQPKNWDSRFIKDITNISNKCDCIILDWRLNQHVIKDGYTVAYKGAELGQLIRRNTAEKKFRSLPIFLWSTDENLGHSYTDDFTSHDLFDRIYKKDTDLKGPELLQSGKEMMFFIEFYKILRSLRRGYNLNDFLSILGLEKESAHWLDERAKEYLVGLISSSSSRIPLFSRFIYKDIVRTSGILISESLLATRMGVDMEKSKSWKKILSHKFIKSIEYNGFFKNDAEPLFWMQGLYEFWAKIAPNENSLFLTDAEKRVAMISTALKIDSLLPLKKNGKYFWYLDNKTKVPLDPDFGQQSAHNVKFSWQDPLFVLEPKKNKNS